jgi:hypothetical protein
VLPSDEVHHVRALVGEREVWRYDGIFRRDTEVRLPTLALPEPTPEPTTTPEGAPTTTPEVAEATPTPETPGSEVRAGSETPRRTTPRRRRPRVRRVRLGMEIDLTYP